MREVVMAIILVLSCAFGCFSQQLNQTLRGQVEDQLGALIVGATVTLIDVSGIEKTSVTDAQGGYKFSGLAPGKYAVRATAPGFAVAERTDIEVRQGNNKPTNFRLEIAATASSVTVDTQRTLSTDLGHNASSTVLRGEDLEALPDDPDDLAEMLRAMAGPGAGLGGGQFLVDGYSGGSLPSKDSIREVRLNENPFSAEYDKLGFGRVEIITKTGTDKLRGQLFFNFNDESLNARNPFAANRAPFQSRFYGGSVSGPIIPNKLSFFMNVEQRNVTDNAVVNAIVLDDALRPVQFNPAVVVPQTRTSINPRLDFQINPRHSLVFRYSFLRLNTENAGVGDFSLPSTAYDTSFRQHNLQLTETAILSPSVVNELRFQFVNTHRGQKGDNSIPNLRVLEAFTGGGSPIGLAFNDENRFELQDNLTAILPGHILRGGARLRGVRVLDSTSQNFGGTYTFAGGLAPQLDANNQLVLDPATGQPVLVQISSIERYRRTLFFKGLDPASLRLLGGGATQFSIATGNPSTRVGRLDLGTYFQDDWQVRPGLTLGLGVRYETQNNIHSPFNFAPRLSFAWAPGAGTDPKTVIRGGFGVFYDRVSETLTLQAERFNGINQSQFVITDPNLLAAFPNVPVLAAPDPSAQIIRRDSNLQAPYSIQSGISIERQLPLNTTMAVSFVDTRVLHALRSRNINAPLPGTVVPGDPTSGIHPLGPVGNVFQYESSGVFRQKQLVFNLYNESNRYVTAFGSFILNHAKGDTDGSESFPANSYDLTQEYGRAFLDSRYRFIGGGTVNAPWGIRLSPIIIASSGRPFNITTGRDTNGDTLFTERPSFATDLQKPGVVVTKFGAFDTNPEPGQTIIPRNFGQGPAFFVTILRLNKTFALGNAPMIAGKPGEQGRRGEQPYRLSLSVQIMNLFNHNNAGTVIGNLSSPLFGQSNATSRGSFSDGSAAGSFNSRRIELQVRFNF
jgi:hypothetical protein